MSIELVADVLVIVFLCVTIGFAVKLNKRLMAFYQDRQELQEFMDQFTLSLSRADSQIKDLRGLGESVFKSAQEQTQKAQALRDDLVFLMQRGEDLAQTLESGIRSARDISKTTELRSHKTEAAKQVSAENDDELPELLKALQNIR